MKSPEYFFQNNMEKNAKNISAIFEKSQDVSEEEERLTKENVGRAVFELEKEWGVESPISFKVSIIGDNDFRIGKPENGPQYKKFCFLLRDNDKDMRDPEKNVVYVNINLFKTLPTDAYRMIKHEISHIVVGNLVNDLGTYQKSFFLEEGTAGLEGATESLVKKLKEIGAKEVPDPLLIKNINDAKMIGGDTDKEPFTEQLGDLVIMSFVGFMMENQGKQKILEVYKKLANSENLEDAYRKICGVELIEERNIWKKLIEDNIR